MTGGATLRWLLAASLALNLFLVAFLIGQRWQPWRPPAPVLEEEAAAPMRGLRPAIHLRQIMATLPPEDAALLRQAVVRRIPLLRAARLDFFAAIEALRTEIMRSPPSAPALQAAIAEVRRKQAPFTIFIEELLVETVPQMSEAGRRALGQYRMMQ